MRQTSIDAYNAIKESGLLGKRQKHAYNVLYKDGPLTGNELSELMRIPGQWKRCSELKKRRLAIEVGKRPCRVTGRECLTWDVTSNMPVPYVREKLYKLTKQQLIDAGADLTKLGVK